MWWFWYRRKEQQIRWTKCSSPTIEPADCVEYRSIHSKKEYSCSLRLISQIESFVTHRPTNYKSSSLAKESLVSNFHNTSRFYRWLKIIAPEKKQSSSGNKKSKEYQSSSSFIRSIGIFLCGRYLQKVNRTLPVATEKQGICYLPSISRHVARTGWGWCGNG